MEIQFYFIKYLFLMFILSSINCQTIDTSSNGFLSNINLFNLSPNTNSNNLNKIESRTKNVQVILSFQYACRQNTSLKSCKGLIFWNDQLINILQPDQNYHITYYQKILYGKAGRNVLRIQGYGNSDQRGLTIDNIVLLQKGKNINLITNGDFQNPKVPVNVLFLYKYEPWKINQIQIGRGSFYNKQWNSQVCELDGHQNNCMEQQIFFGLKNQQKLQTQPKFQQFFSGDFQYSPNQNYLEQKNTNSQPFFPIVVPPVQNKIQTKQPQIIDQIIQKPVEIITTQNNLVDKKSSSLTSNIYATTLNNSPILFDRFNYKKQTQPRIQYIKRVEDQNTNSGSDFRRKVLQQMMQD